MAELFLRQGNPHRALAVYRHVFKNRPNDAGIRVRLAELEEAYGGRDLNFTKPLQDLVENVAGCTACTLMGFDGVPLGSFEVGTEFDAHGLFVESAITLQQLQRLLQAQPVGNVTQLVVHTEQAVLVLHPLNAQYFVAAVLKPEAIVGKASYLLRRIAPRLLEALA